MKRSSLRSKLKDVLPPALVRVLIRGKIAFMTVWWSLRCAVKKTWFLRSIYRALENDGYMAITAIPDFERIARAYLGKKPGIVSPVFDLLNVYRYTHGEPEGAPDWLAQLHKSLFDAPTLCMLLKQAGFGSYCLFVYAYRTDRIAISFGVIAYKEARAIHWDRKVIRQLLGPLAPDVNSSSLRIITRIPDYGHVHCL